MTFNVHSVLHLCESVRKSGPLWATSAFPFEGGIYILKQQISSPKSVDEQIAQKMLQRATHMTFEKMYLKSEKCSFFCESFLSGNKYSTLQFIKTENNATLVGTRKVIDDIKLYCSLFANIANYQNCNTWTTGYLFKRCIFSKTVFHTAMYSDTIKTNDSIVQIRETNEIVEISDFLLFNNMCYFSGRILKTMPEVHNETV